MGSLIDETKQPDTRPVLITGATGGQGGSVAAHAFKRGLRVRALVRDLNSEAARSLADTGIELAVGDFNDASALAGAMEGVRGVFSMQQDGAPLSEFRTLLDAAIAAGVEQYVHSTVSGVPQQEEIYRHDADELKPDYWPSKINQERWVRSAPFRYRAFLRPALILDNLVLRASFLYPRLGTNGDILIAMPPDQPLSFVSYDTIGRAGAEMLADPQRFHGAEIELADAYVSYAELARVLQSGSGKAVSVTSVDVDEAVALGLPTRVARSHVWLANVGYPARPEMLKRHGIEPLAVTDWVSRYIGRIRIGN
ncbi:NmrA family NAD(P)-binding protein [Mesorhizobium sp. CO1-1-11]|uniref:NmrA family NAD(P)-binding protein n=1 Tax=Mesorhizobium sp. CO1-1-11 TaxID=2876636 RepID=UPI001CCE0AB3|nr:NmrA family NAD(P)-binding protein [Mesorhizobium sp. CO1-1-11]MBZ9726298.1 NmrA family NAD(P)-binding protein [Mesorhizobium sp. CO1-1-11]